MAPVLASSVVIRARYGVYHDPPVYMAIASRMAPASAALHEPEPTEHPGEPADAGERLQGFAGHHHQHLRGGPELPPGYAQNWQLSIQRDLPGGLVGSGTYLGIKGTHGQQQFLPHTYPAGRGNPCPACPSGYIYLTSSGNSSRTSGQLQLRRRMHSGFAAQLSYTFSKSIDDAADGKRRAGRR